MPVPQSAAAKETLPELSARMHLVPEPERPDIVKALVVVVPVLDTLNCDFVVHVYPTIMNFLFNNLNFNNLKYSLTRQTYWPLIQGEAKSFLNLSMWLQSSVDDGGLNPSRSAKSYIDEPG